MLNSIFAVCYVCVIQVFYGKVYAMGLRVVTYYYVNTSRNAYTFPVVLVLYGCKHTTIIQLRFPICYVPSYSDRVVLLFFVLYVIACKSFTERCILRNTGLTLGVHIIVVILILVILCTTRCYTHNKVHLHYISVYAYILPSCVVVLL